MNKKWKEEERQAHTKNTKIRDAEMNMVGNKPIRYSPQQLMPYNLIVQKVLDGKE